MTTEAKTVLVLGASGMLGNAVFRLLGSSTGFRTIGTLRSSESIRHFDADLREKLVTGIDLDNEETLVATLRRTKPDVVVNCVGMVKQLAEADDPLIAMPINALLPHRLSNWCAVVGSRLIHVSTDCVFSGDKGMYTEADTSDACDLYGRTKYMGEVHYPHTVTLRTSIIGHELTGNHSLVGWFLSQSTGVKGYRKAVFSGLPTVELAGIIRDHVIPRPELRGLYHVSAQPINKYELLKLVAKAYEKQISITPDDGLQIDRSLDSSRFRKATGYVPPEWPELIRRMREFA